MATQGTVTINIVGDVSRLRGALNEAESGLAGFSAKMQSLGSQMMQFGTRMSLGVTLPLALLGKQAFDAASDLNESLSKVGVVFGDSAAEIKRWSRTAADAMGISRQAALEAAGTFGNLFSALGIGREPAAAMSKSLVQLASDLASFNNANPQDVLVALRSGLVGEVEPLRKFGVSLSAARVEAKAMEMGLADVNGELSDAAKAQARYAIILEDTALAQGDFARTADDAANKQRRMNAKFDDAKAKLGQALIPIFQKVSGVIAKITEWFAKLDPRWQSLITYVGIAAAAIGPLAVGLGGLVTVIGALASPVVLIGAAIAALVAAAVALYVKWDEVWSWIRDHPAIAAIIALLTGPVTIPIFALIAAIKFLQEHWDTIWPALRDTASAVWDVIRPVLAALDAAIRWVADAAQWLYAKWVEVWPVISGFVSARWEQIRPILEALWAALGKVVDIAQWVGAAAVNGFDVLADAVRTAWNHVKGPLDWIIDKLEAVVSAAKRVKHALDGIPGFGGLPGAGGFPLVPGIPNIPGVPFLADGALVTGPTLAVIGEGPEHEVVLPLSKLGAYAGGGTSVTLNAEIHVHGDTSPEGVVSALASWVRSNGAVPATVRAAFA
jgi:hypothetical protein